MGSNFISACTSCSCGSAFVPQTLDFQGSTINSGIDGVRNDRSITTRSLFPSILNNPSKGLLSLCYRIITQGCQKPEGQDEKETEEHERHSRVMTRRPEVVQPWQRSPSERLSAVCSENKQRSADLVDVGHFAIDHLALEWLHYYCSVVTSKSRLSAGRQDFALADRSDLNNRDDVSSSSQLLR